MDLTENNEGLTAPLAFFKEDGIAVTRIMGDMDRARKIPADFIGCVGVRGDHQRHSGGTGKC
jgi:hypothetical protein